VHVSKNIKFYYENIFPVIFDAFSKLKANESEKDFISRCEKFMHEENSGKLETEKRSNQQITTICYSAVNLKLRNVQTSRSRQYVIQPGAKKT